MIDSSVFGTKGTVGAKVCKPMDRRAEIQARSERLKQARESAGFGSARKAAIASGWNYETYRAHENGRNGFEIDIGRIYAEHYRVDVAWLMTGSGDPPAPANHSVNPVGIATRVKRARIYANFSRSKLAEKLGLSRTAVFLWESGESIPATQNLETIAAITRVSLPWLATGIGDMAQVLKFAHTLATRVRTRRAQLGYSREDLAVFSNLDLSVIEAIESGQSSHAPIAQIAQALKISTVWLESGGLDVPQPSGDDADLKDKSNQPGRVIPPAGAEREIFERQESEVLELDARRPVRSKGNAGEVDLTGIKGKWTIPDEYLRELKIAAERALMIEVIGDSMAPTYNAGDRVILDTSYTRPTVNGVYAIDEGDGPIIQRLQLVRGSKPEMVDVISDNPRHPPYKLELGNVLIIGLVRSRLSKA